MTKKERVSRHDQFVYFCDTTSLSMDKNMKEASDLLCHGSHKDRLNWEDGYQKGYCEALRTAQRVSRNMLRVGVFDD